MFIALFLFIISVLILSSLTYSLFLSDYLYVKNCEHKWEYKKIIYDKKIIEIYESTRTINGDVWRFCFYKYGGSVALNGFRNDKTIVEETRIWRNCFEIHSNSVKRSAEETARAIIELHV
jgi:hypothetical protein